MSSSERDWNLANDVFKGMKILGKIVRTEIDENRIQITSSCLRSSRFKFVGAAQEKRLIHRSCITDWLRFSLQERLASWSCSSNSKSDCRCSGRRTTSPWDCSAASSCCRRPPRTTVCTYCRNTLTSRLPRPRSSGCRWRTTTNRRR